MAAVASTLICCLRADRLLLLRRRKAPFADHWVPPGGKIEAGESPRQCALRELREETGLEAPRLEFRGLIHESSPDPTWEWQITLYLAHDPEGRLAAPPYGETPAEAVAWVPIDGLAGVAIPPSDRLFLPRALAGGPPFEARFFYDTDFSLLDHHWEA
ncbi:hypothetical protein CKO38_10925 [Rhodospirillum rubrum]|uniref:NUDIX hydrolase n=1 Tax=Rhodospirillum rubrum TaxID=1085 RepID=UPI0019062828|nr:NUDIX domain-containing protein [Rhodospirillum rubrum]MBK1665298.1 hypothetical protein [Rhodospirillum rubrum]MBK1677167.1 hypothetical protein [Rhodospirillum rubrum]